MASTSNGDEYLYDYNGNMTHRDPAGSTYYDFTYDTENRLISVSGSATASFGYGPDGMRVKSTIMNVLTVFIGNY